jgi:hypothetical protein
MQNQGRKTTMKKTLIITGSAPDVLDDIARLRDMMQCSPDFMAIGLDAVDKYPRPIQYVATYHPAEIPKIKARRGSIGGNTDYKVISMEARDGVDIVEPFRPPSGSSSHLGALAAIRMGYERIILCGCPLEGKNAEGGNYDNFRKGWEDKKSELGDRVRSMSGWTREFLGAPDAVWLGKITIGACWDGRDYYSPEYVNRLYRACLRNTTIPFDFVLYVGPEAEKPGRTATLDPNIRIVPVGLPYWWSGMVFWKEDPPGIETATILYLDLDQVIIGSLDDLIRFPSDHACMKDYPSHSCPSGLEQDACVSTTLIRNGAGARVWEEYVRAGKPVWNPLGGSGPLPMAAQEIVNGGRYGVRKDLFPEAWICSYKLEVRKRGLPEDCRIVAFHGRPKQHECDEAWIKEHWR